MKERNKNKNLILQDNIWALSEVQIVQTQILLIKGKKMRKMVDTRTSWLPLKLEDFGVQMDGTSVIDEAIEPYRKRRHADEM